MKKGLVLGALACLAAAVVALPAAAFSWTPTAYNNIPNPRPGNVPSVGGEAYAFSELGGQVQLLDAERPNPTVTVLMSSWGCESGNWYSATCSTTPGSGFRLPITLNIYSVGPANALGSLIRTKTRTFSIPYRPSSDLVNCTGGRWFKASNSTCYNGLATPIKFSFTNVSLPEKVIVTVAYNTSHYGNAPYGQSTACYTSSGGCGYDSLNIGLIDNTVYPTQPTNGGNPVPNGLYWDTQYGGNYCDGGTGGVGTLRLDDGCWAPYQPAFKITVTRPLCHVPNLIGMTISAAKSAISAGNCTTGVVTKVGAPHLYIVTSQHPAAGSTLLYPGRVSFTATG